MWLDSRVMELGDLLEIPEYDVFVVANRFGAFGTFDSLDVEFYDQRQVSAKFLFSFDELSHNGSAKGTQFYPHNLRTARKYLKLTLDDKPHHLHDHHKWLHHFVVVTQGYWLVPRLLWRCRCRRMVAPTICA